MSELWETLTTGLVLSLLVIGVSYLFWKRYDKPTPLMIERQEERDRLNEERKTWREVEARLRAEQDEAELKAAYERRKAEERARAATEKANKLGDGRQKGREAKGGRRQVAKPVTFKRQGPKLRRNDPCHCGSGKKYKNCHMKADMAAGGDSDGEGAAAASAEATSSTASPSSARRAIGVPTATFSLPASTRMTARTPSSTASTSMVALSVSISAITSPLRTASPTATFQVASVPVSMVGDRAGIRISIAISKPP